MITVLIADDHPVVAEGLRNLLEDEPDITVVACVTQARDAVPAAVRTRPDVVLMDYRMGELNGIEAAYMIRERLPQTRVLILSMESEIHFIVRALRAGASGYVAKKSAAKEVIRAIREVYAGRRYLQDDVREEVLDSLMDDRPGSGDPLSLLSSRERQVLQLLAEGSTNADIAARLSLSPKTVETYRARMMDKLDVRDLAGLLRFAIRHGIAPLD
ncbi:MAG TPA: response regulator transcription factor [Usitatibacter sp.]|jgi:DNA-binding NarL/FixJ family response regulator|nr:response regulator transcription factor [Usitatibacter sp.]